MELTAKAILVILLQLNHMNLDLTDVDKNAVYCLATNIYHEARGEPVAGQVAVANVTLNRVTDRRWPGTVCGVVRQAARDPETREVALHRCQFSWYCDGYEREISFSRAHFRKDVETIRDIETRAWVTAVEVALLVKRGQVLDNTEGATHYHARRVRPGWARFYTKTAQYGRHIFYRREIGSLQ